MTMTTDKFGIVKDKKGKAIAIRSKQEEDQLREWGCIT
jgi:hypothetical protein